MLATKIYAGKNIVTAFMILSNLNLHGYVFFIKKKLKQLKMVI